MGKNIPLRQCIACRNMKEKNTLVRVVKNTLGDISVDKIGKLPGRGTYVCLEEDCFKKIQKSKALERNLSTSIPPEIYQELESVLLVQRQEVQPK